MRSPLTRTLMLAASAVAFLAAGLSASAKPQRLEKLDGFLLLRGQSAMLFPSRRTRGAFEFDKCRNLGASAAMFRRLKDAGSGRVTLWVRNLGEPYAAFDEPIYYKRRLNGRAIQPWCDSRTIYWVQRFGSSKK